jgi:hypothetical protein
MKNGHGLSSRMRYGEKIDAGQRFLLLVSDSLSTAPFHILQTPGTPRT